MLGWAFFCPSRRLKLLAFQGQDLSLQGLAHPGIRLEWLHGEKIEAGRKRSWPVLEVNILTADKTAEKWGVLPSTLK